MAEIVEVPVPLRVMLPSWSIVAAEVLDDAKLMDCPTITGLTDSPGKVLLSSRTAVKLLSDHSTVTGHFTTFKVYEALPAEKSSVASEVAEIVTVPSPLRVIVPSSLIVATEVLDEEYATSSPFGLLRVGNSFSDASVAVHEVADHESPALFVESSPITSRV